MPYLYLSYPAIPFEAKVRGTNSGVFSDDRPVGNIICGERYQYASCTAAASGVISNDWDLGVGNSQAVDHIIIANASRLSIQGTTNFQLLNSSDAVTYSAQFTDSSFPNALKGPDNLDYIQTGLNISAKRAWRTYFSGGSATTRTISKIYFGTAWNPDKDPDSWDLKRLSSGGSVKLEDGGNKLIRLADSRYQFSVKWVGVNDANSQIFLKKIKARWQQHKFFLFTTGNHRILNNMQVLHVRFIDEPQISRGSIIDAGLRTGYSTITCNFLECRG